MEERASLAYGSRGRVRFHKGRTPQQITDRNQSTRFKWHKSFGNLKASLPLPTVHPPTPPTPIQLASPTGDQVVRSLRRWGMSLIQTSGGLYFLKLFTVWTSQCRRRRFPSVSPRPLLLWKDSSCQPQLSARALLYLFVITNDLWSVNWKPIITEWN